MTLRDCLEANEPRLDTGSGQPKRALTLRHRSRRWRRASGRWLAMRVGAFAIRRLADSCRRTELGREHRTRVEAEHGAVIIALWHGRGVTAAPFYDVESATVLVSASDDGSMATMILGKLGYEIIRGSSNRHGVRALRALIDCLQRGKHIAITPDGPRGPLHSMSPGVAFLSRATGIPVLPIGFAVDRAWHLKTWDRYTIPRPRSHVVACYRPAVVVPRDATNERLAELSLEIGEGIRAAERQAFAHLGLPPDWEAEPPREEGR